MQLAHDTGNKNWPIPSMFEGVLVNFLYLGVPWTCI